MTKARASLAALLSALAAVACTSESVETPDPTGEETPGPGGDCATTGAGRLVVNVSGLPDGLAASVTLAGPGSPRGVTATTTIEDAAAGSYAVTAERVASVDPIVRALYAPTVSTDTVCVGGAAAQTVNVSYAMIPSSNALWTANANADAQLLGYRSVSLGATGTPAASVAARAGIGRGLAFDKDGNLWTTAATTADATLSRYAASALGSSGDKTPDRTLNPALTGCGPNATALAFDPSGALWVTLLCEDKVLRIAPETLAATADYTPAAGDYTTSALDGPRGVAFDAEGNMWVSDATKIHRFAAASLAAGQPHASTFAIEATTQATGGAELPPDVLAFDGDGNLWVTSFGGNVVFKLTPADLVASGTLKTVVPSVQITIGVGALLESAAFDESGGYWFTYSQGKLARLAPSQLGTSSGSGDPTIPATVITSADIGYASGIAFFPAPSALPLHAPF